MSAPFPPYAKERMGATTAKTTGRINNAQGAIDSLDATTLPQLAATANNLALDKPDVAFATQELYRCFATPTKDAYDALKKLGRYLAGCSCMVWDAAYRPSRDNLVTSVNTDVARCLATRRSTSGDIL